MEVDKISGVHGGAVPTSDRVQRNEGEFQRVLEQKLSETTPPAGRSLGKSRAALLRQGDEMLRVLEAYAEALRDPARSLRQMEPLVARLQDQARRLQAGTAETAAGDPDLARWLRDLTLTVNVAVLKFHRGDFL